MLLPGLIHVEDDLIILTVIECDEQYNIVSSQQINVDDPEHEEVIASFEQASSHFAKLLASLRRHRQQ